MPLQCKIIHEVIRIKLYDDGGHEITTPAMLKVLKAVAGLVADVETGQKEPEEDTYDDIIVYDDDGNRITNIATLRAMLLLIANDSPLPPEWKDHQLKGIRSEIRECHIKGDLLLVYRINYDGTAEDITFLREVFIQKYFREDRRHHRKNKVKTSS